MLVYLSTAKDSLMMYRLYSVILALVVFSQALPNGPVVSLSLTQSRNTSSLSPPSWNSTSTPLGEWPPTPLVIDVSPDLQAVIKEYGDVFMNPRRVSAVRRALHEIEEMILHDTVTHEPHQPIVASSWPAVFYVDLLGLPWTSFKRDVAELVLSLSLFTTVYRAATVIERGELRSYNHQSPRAPVAEFRLGFDFT